MHCCIPWKSIKGLPQCAVTRLIIFCKGCSNVMKHLGWRTGVITDLEYPPSSSALYFYYTQEPPAGLFAANCRGFLDPHNPSPFACSKSWCTRPTRPHVLPAVVRLPLPSLLLVLLHQQRRVEAVSLRNNSSVGGSVGEEQRGECFEECCKEEERCEEEECYEVEKKCDLLGVQVSPHSQ